jgi:hypothetical protein
MRRLCVVAMPCSMQRLCGQPVLRQVDGVCARLSAQGSGLSRYVCPAESDGGHGCHELRGGQRLCSAKMPRGMWHGLRDLFDRVRESRVRRVHPDGVFGFVFGLQRERGVRGPGGLLLRLSVGGYLVPVGMRLVAFRWDPGGCAPHWSHGLRRRGLRLLVSLTLYLCCFRITNNASGLRPSWWVPCSLRLASLPAAW